MQMVYVGSIPIMDTNKGIIIMKTLKEMVSGEKKVFFSHFHEQNLWYVTECGFMFPVPISDTGQATFKNEDKAMFFMRWIRAYMKYLADAKAMMQTAD